MAEKIKVSGNQLCLLVLDGEAYEQALYQGHDLQSVARASKGESCNLPRLCHITRAPDAPGLGIGFTPVDGSSRLSRPRLMIWSCVRRTRGLKVLLLRRTEGPLHCEPVQRRSC